MAVGSYRDLLVGQKAMDYVVACYRATDCFPKEERYGLASQLKSAAVSIPANIAEGQGREHTREFMNFLSIARGSLCETETHLLVAERLGYLRPDDVKALAVTSDEIARMLTGLIRSLEKKL